MNQSKYDKLEIPKELSCIVNDAIETGLKEEKEKIKVYKRVIGIAAVVLLLAFVIPLNIVPSYAKAVSQIPIIGEFAKIFTFKEYHFEDEIRYIDARIPKFAYDGKSELEKRVNQEISKIINEELKNAENNAKEYYEAFIATGGDPKEYIPRGIHVDYEIKCITEKQVSFVISKSETLASAYFVQYFYNIDMETGRYMTLKDLLGNDYKEIAVQSIENAITGWSEEKKMLLFEDVNLEDLIDENTNFYIDEQNNIVIVFGKYEIAAGAAGILEFPIEVKER
ncbi:DUF3298 and DUF4163 domain-containing protein [Thomasclavelia cocleata]|jgi:hypothetical protein|uniref:DUF3298 and DUF4163 domain-containing protein n=1 Tax=Thomasclavelia cocleata TaxID=69824 RepID=UPI00272EE22C|nr:DUF3298 and DUF4163 domain-containing protein [Thomasclavelia cocleata]MCI9275461.1 DUF3298 and DUF4163 domain-containing protein [Clostridia bacterium]